MLAIVDSGGANIASVRFALERLGIHSELTADPTVIRSAERVILPGVGSAAEGMKRLQARGLVDCVRGLTQPVLGVCLGMQLLFESSEEGPTETLGLIPGRVALLPGSPGITVPHMGWNTVSLKKECPLFSGISPESEFYFVHSYYPSPAPEYTIATTYYGKEFCSVHGRDGLWSAQFHPEKSGRPGLKMLSNFYEYCREAANAQ